MTISELHFLYDTLSTSAPVTISVPQYDNMTILSLHLQSDLSRSHLLWDPLSPSTQVQTSAPLLLVTISVPYLLCDYIIILLLQHLFSSGTISALQFCVTVSHHLCYFLSTSTIVWLSQNLSSCVTVSALQIVCNFPAPHLLHDTLSTFTLCGLLSASLPCDFHSTSVPLLLCDHLSNSPM